ncbi:MAG: ribose 5-phosphate isomerase B [Raoultibacter sp.]|jgi:ribose 5-phosphate isomerase B
MRVSIASDHAGFAVKQKLIIYLQDLGHEVVDQGPENDERVDYPDYAARVAESVLSGETERGILVCGTGIGMAMKANKYSGIRAANVTTAEFAALSREHNDANVLCLSARFVDIKVNESIIDAFLNTEFGKGRHAQRVEKIG